MSHQTEAREHLATAMRRPSSRPLAKGLAELALPEKPGIDPANDPIVKARVRRDGECKVNYDIWTEMHDKTIKAILAKQHEENIARYAAYQAQKSGTRSLGKEPDRNHVSVWGYLHYQKVGDMDPPIPNLGEEDTIVYSQVEDFSLLEAPTDRRDDIRQYALRAAQFKQTADDSKDVRLAKMTAISTSVEWFRTQLASDLNIIGPGMESDSFGDNSWIRANRVQWINLQIGGFRCTNDAPCPFQSEKEAEADRQLSMKDARRIGIKHVIELHER